MNELLNHPAVQAGVVPFAAAGVVAALLMRSRLLGLAIGSAFVTVIALTIGFSFEVMTSTRKMVMLALLAIAMVPALEIPGVQPTLRVRGLLAAAAAAAGVWLVWRVLQQAEVAAAVMGGLAAAAYMAALVGSSPTAHQDPVAAASGALMLGLGSGVLAFLGASVTMLQIGVAVGAGAGAVLLVQMIAGRRSPTGWTVALPAAAVAGTVGVLSVATGTLRWYMLLPMLAVPWAPRLVPAGQWPVWPAAVGYTLAALVPVAISVALAWFAGGQAAA